jgi:hypothetical protein
VVVSVAAADDRNASDGLCPGVLEMRGGLVGGTSAEPRRYALSFTAGGLLSREAAVLAPVYLRHRDWERARHLGVETNLLQARTRSTALRLVREAVERLSALADHEVEILAEATASERGHLMWAAACRRYEFIGEFAEEVLRERFLLLASSVEYSDFDSFVRTKALWHDELGKVTDSTLRRLRANVFKMLREADLLSKTWHIVPPMLSGRVAVALSARMPSDMRFFPIQQSEMVRVAR